MKKDKKLRSILIHLIIIILLITFGVIMYEYIASIDVKILQFIRKYLMFDTAKYAMYVVSMLLSPIPMIIIWLIVFVSCKSKDMPLLLFINCSLSLLTNFILKNIFKRQRPFEFMLIDIDGYSFPSTHALLGTVFYGTLIYVVNSKVKDKKIKIALDVFLWIFLILTPISRVYLGVHNLSDVFIGVLIGFLVVNISVYFKRRIEKKEEVNRLEAAK